MQIQPTAIPDILLLEPRVFADERGFFFESYNQQVFAEKTGLKPQFVQDNHSRSRRHTLRGLHYQIERAQAKLIRTIVGEILDIAVDLRRSSTTFGQWTSSLLSADNKRQLWIPVGFAHGFVVRSEVAEVLYKTTDFYAPQHERCLRWNDPSIGIDWGLSAEPIVSAKDQQGLPLAEADCFP